MNKVNNLSPQIRKIFDDALTKLSMDGRNAFFSNGNDIFNRSLLHFNPEWDNN